MDIQNVCSDCGLKYGKASNKHIGVWKANCDICGKYGRCAAPRDFSYLPNLPKKIKKPEIQVISQDEFWELIGGDELSKWMKYCSTKPDDSDRDIERNNFKYLYSNHKLG